MLKVYDLHSPKNKFYGVPDDENGQENLLSVNEAVTLAESMGLSMKEFHIPNGLNTFEEKHPMKAVIFDVRSEDVIMVEK